jgi:hypothetical protein
VPRTAELIPVTVLLGRFRTARRLFRAARALTRAERLLLGEAAAVALAVRIGLRALRLPVLVSRLDRLPRTRSTMPADRAARLADAVATRVAGPTCLRRALVIFAVLRRRGEPAELVLGARRRHDAFEAHAWLRLRDAVIVEASDQQTYAPLWQSGAPTVQPR